MILHLTRKEKFTKPFIDFIKENFDISEHFFLLVGGQNKKEFYIEDDSYIKTISNKKDFLKYFIEFNKKMYKADKIIIHGLSQPYNIFYLFLNPWLLKKCYWIIWGADLYLYSKLNKTIKEKLIEYTKQNIIKKIGFFVTGTYGEYELAMKWYGARGKYIKAFVYTSNIYNENISLEKKENNEDTIYIMIGNSADPSNKHIEILHKLNKYSKDNIELIVPLSYGDKEYSDKIIEIGKELYGNKFLPLLDFLSLDDYIKILSKIDIAIFNHDRQQGMGNIITLLGLGKKVYMKSNVTTWKTFLDNNIIVYDVQNEITLQKIDEKIKNKNINNIKKTFSKESFIEQLNNIFIAR